MTKEEIEQYIDLDNKIKNRIVQISHALQGVDSSLITAITPHVKQCFSNGAYDKKKKAEDYKRKLEAEKKRQTQMKKKVEEKEYEQYLRLKKKFEKE